MPRRPYRPERWVLSDPGGADAFDLIVITAVAAQTLRAFSYDAEPAPERYGYANAFVAPRWVLELGGLAYERLQRAHSLADARVLDHVPKFILRGRRDPDYAAAVFVVLEAEGIPALAAFVEPAV